MKSYHWIIAVILLLAANNYVLLNLIGYFDDSREVIAKSDLSKPLNPSRGTPKLSNENSREANQSVVRDQEGEEEQSDVSSNEQPDFENAFREFTQTDDFVAVMDRYQMTAGNRMMKAMERLAKKSAQELYQTLITTDSPTEKQLALQELMRGKLNDLSVTELKNIYAYSEGELFGKYQALQVLLEKDDSEAIEWAKEAINDPMLAMTGGYEIFSALYDKDPEYIKAHVEGLRMSDLNNTRVSLSMFIQDKELQKIFFQNNLDEILASDSSEVFQMSPYNLKLEMNQEQQASLTELYSSNNRHKRNFAIYLTRNIEDPQLLREAYGQLRSKQDRQSMLSIMISNEAQKNVARELAAQSDDEDIFKFSQTPK